VATKQYKDYSLNCKHRIRRFSSKSGDVLQFKGEEILSGIWRRNLQNPHFINKRLWSNLKHDDIWKSSFLKLVENRDSNTSYANNQRIAKISLDKVMIVKMDLLEGRYRWGHSRRIFITKTEEKRLCLLTIGNFRDKLVQEVLRKLLSCIYEPCFNHHSHGFRLGRSYHTALKDVRKNFKRCNNLFEGDISCFFDTISYSYLILLLRKKLKDERIISLISQGLKNKTIIPKTDEMSVFYSGFSQVGLLSPLLLNIYLHELDKYMYSYIKEYNGHNKLPYLPDYMKVTKKLNRRKATRKLRLTSTIILSDALKRVRYVRYVNNFVTGLICSQTQAHLIKNHIKIFLQNLLYLELNYSKTILIDIAPRKHFKCSSEARFLGYLLFMPQSITTRTSKNSRILTGSGLVILKIDQRKVINQLSNKGFCTKDGSPRPKFTYIHNTQIVTNEKINRIVRSIIIYYKQADNIRHFGCRLFYVFSHSLAKLYAAKYRWPTKASILKRGKRNLSQPLPTKSDNERLGRITDLYHVPLRGIIYSHYADIPKPIRAPLTIDFPSSFKKTYKGN